MDQQDQIDANRRNWNERVRIHKTDTQYYNIERFMAGELSFKAAEHLDLDVRGKTVLHLQCHFGLDTMSLSRLGAIATGVDISDEAIKLASTIRDELGLDTRFVTSDVLDLPNHLDGQFDIVFASVGVLTWIPDLARWAAVAAHFLKHGGVFYLKDGHPICNALELEDGIMTVELPYFADVANMFDDGRTYAGEGEVIDNPTNYQWDHTMSDIISALLGAGLQLTRFEEYSHTYYQRYSDMLQHDDGFWYLPPELDKKVPLSYLIMATK